MSTTRQRCTTLPSWQPCNLMVVGKEGQPLIQDEMIRARYVNTWNPNPRTATPCMTLTAMGC